MALNTQQALAHHSRSEIVFFRNIFVAVIIPAMEHAGAIVDMLNNPTPSLWPLVFYFAATLVLVIVVLALPQLISRLLKTRAPETGAGNSPFESGIIGVGTAQLHFSTQFYLVAMFFVIFDLEAVFLFAWAIAVRETGWSGFVEALVFIGVLLAALAYLWKLGALDWGEARTFTRSSASTNVIKGTALPGNSQTAGFPVNAASPNTVYSKEDSHAVVIH